MTLYTIAVTTDGSGVGSTTSAQPIIGFLRGVKVTFGGTPAATTDTTIAENGGMGRNLLVLTNVNTSGAYNPQDVIHSNAGAAQTAYSPFYLSMTGVTVTVAQGVASTSNAVTVILDIAPY